jgi:hypothetical protein
MLPPRVISRIKYVLWAALVAAIVASAGKLKSAHLNFSHNQPMAWLCAGLYALVLAILTFAPKLLSPARRSFARVFVFCLRVFAALTLGTVYAAPAIQLEMSAVSAMTSATDASHINIVHMMQYVLLPPWMSPSLADVITYAGSILLIDLFEAILEGVNHQENPPSASAPVNE